MPVYVYWILYFVIGIANFFVHCTMLTPEDARKIAHLPLRQRLAEGYMITGGTDNPLELFSQILIGSIALWPFWAAVYLFMGGVWLVACWTKPTPNHSQTHE